MAETNCNFLKKKKKISFHFTSLPLPNIVECNPSNWKTHNIPSVSSSFFHPISNQHYLLLHSSFNILNYASHSSSVFLSKLVSLWINLYTIFSIELYCVSYFINYIYCESITLWLSVMRKLYERYCRKFGFLQSFT